MNPLKKMKLAALTKKIAKNHALRESGTPAPRDQEIKALLDLAKFYDAHAYDKDIPFAKSLALEAYRAQAILSDSEAQYICGERFMEQGKFWLAQHAGILSHEAQANYAANCFAESFKYLQAAEKNHHALAHRLHGMAYVHGWGVEKDTQQGFKMVIESLDWQDAWDDATKIFEELGLNSQEFFSALGAIRGKNKS